jgi:hypothetical protein
MPNQIDINKTARQISYQKSGDGCPLSTDDYVEEIRYNTNLFWQDINHSGGQQFLTLMNQPMVHYASFCTKLISALMR